MMLDALTDITKSIAEAVLDMVDAFARLKLRTYIITAIVILVVNVFAIWGPTL